MDGEIAFQPLARIDREGYRTWAAEWIEGRLRHEGVAVGPDEKAAIWSALGSLAGAPVEQRTMTGLSVLLQSNALDRKSTRLNSSHQIISYAVFCLKKKKKIISLMCLGTVP